MTKKVADLTVDELDRLAAEAWFEASQSALRAGVPVVGREGEKLVKRRADGRPEILGDAKPLEDAYQSKTLRRRVKKAAEISGQVRAKKQAV
jgi:uncharacterized protein GlcG (DUF336 family)